MQTLSPLPSPFPQVIVIDELQTAAEAKAVHALAARGVAVVAAVNCPSFGAFVYKVELRDLIGISSRQSFSSGVGRCVYVRDV